MTVTSSSQTLANDQLPTRVCRVVAVVILCVCCGDPMKSPFLEAIPSIEKSASTDIYIYSTDHTTFNDIIKLTAASSLGLFNALHATELTGKLSAALNEGLNA